MRAQPNDLEFSEALNSDGALERPAAIDYWQVPASVQLDRDRLVWRWDEGPRSPKWVTVGRGLLEDFLGLVDAPDSRICRYARRWGVLYICRHNLPARHNSRPQPTAKTAHFKQCYLRQTGDGKGYWEPLAVWRDYARRASALLGIADSLHAGRPGNSEHWRVIYSGVPAKMSMGLVERRLLLLTYA
jgi:hypothetical protein